MSNKYVLIDEEFQSKVLNELTELKQLIIQNSSIRQGKQPSDLMDTVDLMQYLKVSRRTVYQHRLNGMPFVRKMNGKLYYRKSEVDKYFSTNNNSDQFMSKLLTP